MKENSKLTSDARFGTVDCSALVFDLDGTLIDTWHRWAERTEWAFEQLAAYENQSVSDLIAQVRENTETDIRCHCLETMIRSIPNLTWKDDFHGKLVERYEEKKIEGLQLFDGMAQAIKNAKKYGAKVVIYTDAPWPEALHAIHHAIEHAGLDHTHFDMVAGQPPAVNHSGEERHYGAHVEKLISKLGTRLYELPAMTHKPSPDNLRLILDEMDLHHSEAIMIGDQARDGGSAKLAGVHGYVNPAENHNGGHVRFAWARYGAVMRKKELSFYSEMFSDSTYPLGEHVVQNHFKEYGFKPDVVLDHSDCLLRRFRFAPPAAEQKQARQAKPARGMYRKRGLKQHR